MTERNFPLQTADPAPRSEGRQLRTNGRGAVWIAGLSVVCAMCGLWSGTGAAAQATKATKANKANKATKRPATLLQPNGAAPKVAGPFSWGGSSAGGYSAAGDAPEALGRLPQTAGLFTLLIIGSDARPGESAVRSRGDSLHLLVFNTLKQRGTLIGFPRDSYVDIPGHGKSKITSALAWGGPELMTSTVSNLTRIPVTNYVVTGFAGFSALIDAVGGVNVSVDPAMNDRFSGATFARGWFAMNGDAALAFNRNRHDVANGDFGRSANQAKFLMHALAQMRGTTSDNRGLLPWVAAVKANISTNLPLKDLFVFAQVARTVDPAVISSILMPGTNGFVKSGKSRQAVVLIKPTAAALFADVALDGTVGK